MGRRRLNQADNQPDGHDNRQQSKGHAVTRASSASENWYLPWVCFEKIGRLLALHLMQYLQTGHDR